jgi:hypothetical protein
MAEQLTERNGFNLKVLKLQSAWGTPITEQFKKLKKNHFLLARSSYTTTISTHSNARIGFVKWYLLSCN